MTDTTAPKPATIFKPLKQGAKIGVMAPSSYVEKDDIEKSAERLKTLGFEIFIHPQTYERDGKTQSAGTILQKSLAFQGLWMRGDIDAIWFAGGGNQSLELLSTINLETLKKRTPKPLIGFSDATTLINAIHHHIGCINYHAPVFKQIHTLDDKQLETALNILSAKQTTLKFSDSQILRSANNQAPQGTLIGGNLSLFQYTQSLLPPSFTQDAILILEDCNEELSHIDRMFSFLKQSNALANIQALLIGGFSKTKDSGRPFGKTVAEIITYHCAEYNFPILHNLPFGHSGENIPLPVGANAIVDFKSQQISFAYP